jgi:hypothetical protein
VERLGSRKWAGPILFSSLGRVTIVTPRVPQFACIAIFVSAVSLAAATDVARSSESPSASPLFPASCDRAALDLAHAGTTRRAQPADGGVFVGTCGGLGSGYTGWCCKLSGATYGCPPSQRAYRVAPGVSSTETTVPTRETPDATWQVGWASILAVFISGWYRFGR